MATVRPDKLRKLSERAEKLQEEIARIRALAAKEERRKEERRKLLAGGLWLDLVERGEWPREQFLEALDKHLSRPRDRELFGLPIDAHRPKDLDPDADSPGSAGLSRAGISSLSGAASAALGGEGLQGSGVE